MPSTLIRGGTLNNLALLQDLKPYKDFIGDKIDYDSKAVGEVIENFEAEGVYVRSMKLPAQRFIVGNVHLYSTVHLVLAGEIILFNSDKSTVRVKAPAIFECKAGLRRAGYTLKPLWYATAHGTGHIPDWVPINHQTNDKVLKRMISCLTREEYNQFLEARSQNGQIQDFGKRNRLTDR